MERTKVPVPTDVLEGLEAVRLSGKTNMMDVPEVMKLAVQMSFPETALWVREYKAQYTAGVLRGFEPAERLDEDISVDMAARFLDGEGGES